MLITRKKLRIWGACYPSDRIAELVPAEGLTPLQVLDLPIPHEDKLWAVLREEVMPATEARLLACTWAELACEQAGWSDPRSLGAIDVARRYAAGEATNSELAVAWAAADAAADEAEAEDAAADVAARVAADAAAGAAAGYAARVVADAAAEAAAEAAAWAAGSAAGYAARVVAARVVASDRATARQLADIRAVFARLEAQS